MALAIALTPAAESEIAPTETVTADVTGGDTWIAAQYDSALGVELVHDGGDFQPRFQQSVVSAITGGFRFVIRRIGGWPGRTLTLRYYEMGAGGGGATMGAPIVDTEQDGDSSGAEVVALQLPFDTSLCASLMVAKLAVLASSASGTATFKIYLGGGRVAAGLVYTGGGTLVATRTIASGVGISKLAFIGTPTANPGGTSYFTLTYQSSGAAFDVSKFGVSGVVE